MAGSIIFAGLMVVGANIRIPLQPVPITLQTLFVLLSGSILGRAFGPLSGAFYLLFGLAGLPVFAQGIIGTAAFVGPTGGYLVGFLIAPLVIGFLIKKSDSTGWTILFFAIGSIIILSCGCIHLSLFYTSTIGDTLRVGFLPFLPGELLKIAAASSIYKSYVAILRYRSSR